MSQKFYSDIEARAGLRDSSGALGTSGQILSSTGSNVSWINQSTAANDVQNRVKAGVAINKGQAVYVTGADGTNIIVGLASNASEATSSKTLGLLNATVAINGMADVVQIGRLSGLNTLGATAGDPVWLGTGGNLIYGLIGKPYAPANLVFIGIVTRVNVSNGEIFVNVQNGFELNEIHDVDLKTTVPINGDVLGFNGTLWVNKTIAGWLGYTPANASGTTNYVSKFTGTTTLGNSQIFDNGTNVGIGTSTPGAKLDVSSGNINLSNSFNLTARNNANTFNIALIGRSSTDRVIIDADGYGTNIGGGGTVLINPSGGNVGIGTTSPASKLNVLGSGTTAISISNSNAGTSGSPELTQLNFLGFLQENRARIEATDVASSANGSELRFYNANTSNVLTERMRIASNGAVKFNAYGSGTFTGTATQKLAVDSSGNIIEIPIGAGPVDGSGTTNYVTKWTDADTIGNSQIFDNGTNVGIGTAGPSTKLEVRQEFSSGSQQFTPALNLRASQGGAWFSQVGLNFSWTDFGNGVDWNTSAIYGGAEAWDGTNSSGNLSFFTKNFNSGTTLTEKMRITNSGNVGIGTSSPNSILHLYKTSYPVLTIGSGTVTGNTGIDTSGNFMSFGTETNHDVSFTTNNTPRMRIASGGNVGIGTSSPGGKLHVVGEGIFDDGTNGRLTFGNGSSQNDIYSTTTAFGDWKDLRYTANNHIFRYAGLEVMRITNGNVGIGTSSPGYKLVVQKTDIATPAIMIGGGFYGGPRLQVYGLDDNATAWMGLGTDMSGGIYEHSIYFPNASGNGRLSIGNYNGTTYSEKMCVINSGNVGIGTTSPGHKLQVSGTAGTSWSTLLQSNSKSAVYSAHADGYGMAIETSQNTSAIYTFKVAGGDGTNIGTNEYFRITGTGNVGIGTSSPSAGLQINRSSWGLGGSNVSRMLQKSVGIAGDYEQHVILLHPIYNGTLIDYNKCSGTIYASRGGTSMGLINDTYYLDTASAYNTYNGTINSVIGNGKLYTCDYNGVKYLALLPDYRTSAVQYDFDGYVKSTGEELKLVVYRLSNSGTVVNSEINNSLAIFGAGTTYYQGNVYTAGSFIGNLSGTADQTSVTFSNSGTTFESFFNSQPWLTDKNYLIYNTSDAPRGGLGLYTVAMNNWNATYGSMFAIDCEPGQGIGYIKPKYGGTFGAWKMLIDNASTQTIGGDKNFTNNLGIGTTSPSKKLTVIDNSTYQLRLASTNSAYSDAGIFMGSDISDPYYYGTIKWDQGAQAVKISSNSASGIGGITFETSPNTSAPTERMRITSGGNVGIGTSSPAAKLQVEGSNSNGLIQAYVTTGGSNALRLNSSFSFGNYIDLNPYISGVSNGGFEISQNGTQRIVISSSGNVGIGTTSPTAKLDVNGDALINNVTIGRGAGNISTNTALGTSALNSTTTANYNIAVGWGANTNNNANGLTAIGVDLNVGPDTGNLGQDCLAIAQFNSNADSAQVPHIYAPRPIAIPNGTTTAVITFDALHYAGAIVEYMIRLDDGGDYRMGTVYMGWKSSGSGNYRDVKQIEWSDMSDFVFDTSGGTTLSLQNTSGSDAWVRITVRGMMTN